MSSFAFKLVAFNSLEYNQTIELRYEVLRKPLGLEFSLEQLKTEKEDWHLGIFENLVCIACCVLTKKEGKILKLRQMAVSPKFQGRKIGKYLLEQAELFAVENGFEKMILNARAHAIPFYEKSGYQTEGEPFEEVGLPHFLMVKNLTENQ
jgi:predicted GNAT family N-acyltransferase